MIAAVNSIQDHRQAAAQVRPNDFHIGALLDNSGEGELRGRHRGFARVAHREKSSRIVLGSIAGAGRVYEHHQLAVVHLSPKVSQLRRMQFQIADIGRNAYAGGAQAERAIELLTKAA